MTASVINPEDRLMEQLHLQEQKYDRATELIEQLAAAAARNEPPSPKLVVALQTQLAQIRSAATGVDTARQALEVSGKTRSAHLNALLQQQAERLSQFLTRIDQLKETFNAGKQQLSAELDTLATRRSMNQAYQRSMKTA